MLTGSSFAFDQVARDPATNESKGYGFVSFDSFEAADAAIESLANQFLLNKTLSIDYAFKKDSKGGERHGTAAERLLAAQARKNNALPPIHAAGARPPPQGGYVQHSQPQQQQQQQALPPPPPPSIPQYAGPPPTMGGAVPPPPPPPPPGMPTMGMQAGYPPQGPPPTATASPRWPTPYAPLPRPTAAQRPLPATVLDHGSSSLSCFCNNVYHTERKPHRSDVICLA